jgi:hypothetical protein
MDHSDETIPQPPSLPPPRRDRHERKRKLYQSCDYCRKRRRACDAASLGIDPFARIISDDGTRPTSCTTCRKAGKECTFQWLHNLPTHNIPPGVRNKLAAGGHTSQQSEIGRSLARLGEDTLPENWTMPDDSSELANPDEDGSYIFGGGANIQVQRPRSTSYAFEVGPAEDELSASLSFDTTEFVNSNFSIDTLHSSFQSPCDNGENVGGIVAEQLEADYSSPSPISSGSSSNW